MKITTLLFIIILLIFVFFAVLALGNKLSNLCPNFKESVLVIGGKELSVGIANTESERVLGLGRCSQVPVGHGLYFPFEEPTLASFWMKDMIIPIDIIWIAQGRVVDIEENVPPPSVNVQEADLPQYRPPVPVDAVLEIGGGQASKQGITIGTLLTKKPS